MADIEVKGKSSWLKQFQHQFQAELSINQPFPTKQRVVLCVFIAKQRVVLYILVMKRSIMTQLRRWYSDSTRKPLILRGARQVGKTWLVREFARTAGANLVEINFEKEPLASTWFGSNDPAKILSEISLARNQHISVDTSILFLDEIQAAGETIAKLRWFAEELPALAVVAAGSLLEFTLTEHEFSMPVGRVQFLHVEPMSFEEYLQAHGQAILLQRLTEWSIDEPFSDVLHAQANEWFMRYGMVGGMPSVVAQETAGTSARQCREIQQDLVATFRADFAKYRGKMNSDILDTTLLAVVRSLGNKYVYSHAGPGIGHVQAKKALEMLAAARVCHLVKHTAAHGLPLGGQTRETFRKVILGDIGLVHGLLQTPAQVGFPRWEQLAPQVRGQLAEQIAGQQLRLLGPQSGDGPQLYYWQREGGRAGEIDYLVQLGTTIVPVELKSGSSGAMKSLHQFMFDKKLECALRIDQNPPRVSKVDLRTTQGNQVCYTLYSLPWYLAGFRHLLERLF